MAQAQIADLEAQHAAAQAAATAKAPAPATVADASGEDEIARGAAHAFVNAFTAAVAAALSTAARLRMARRQEGIAGRKWMVCEPGGAQDGHLGVIGEVK